MKVITNGQTEIGAYMLPDSETPVIGVRRGNDLSVFGHFKSEQYADNFMEVLIAMLGLEQGE